MAGFPVIRFRWSSIERKIIITVNAYRPTPTLAGWPGQSSSLVDEKRAFQLQNGSSPHNYD
ncbi:MAG: hypothetical protein ABGZ24_14505, partial [Fuerstiella sp.]